MRIWRILLVLMLLCQPGLVFGQQKLTALPEVVTPDNDDLLYVVKPGEADPDRKWTIANLKAMIEIVSAGAAIPTTCAELAALLTDETGSGACVFANSPSFNTQISVPQIVWTGTIIDRYGTGSPEGAISAGIGSVYRNLTGGSSTTLYIKESGTGNTGWVPYGNPAGSGAPTTVPFITTVADGGVSAEFALGSLATGLLRNTTTTGIPTIATACTHYLDTTCVLTNANLPTTITGRTLDNTNTVTFLDSLFTLCDNVDSTKCLKFDLTGQTTGLTRTYTGPDANTRLFGASDFAGTHTGRMLRTGSAAFAVCRDNFAGTASPSTTDDTASNYCVGSLWVNTTASPRTVWTASDVTASNAVWVQSGVAATPALQAVSDVGRSITNASSFATGVHIGLSSTSGWRLYDDVSLGPIFTCVVAGVENACDWKRVIASGKIWELQNSSGTPKATFTESTGAWTNFTLDAEATGNTITLPYEDTLEVAGCNNVTASLIFNSNTANAPAATCEGTNTRLATADFDDSTDEGFTWRWRLPTGFTGAIDWILRWKGAATSGAVGWCVQMVRVPTGATSDPSLPAQAAGNCTSTTVAGTTLQEVESTITGVTCTSCVAGDGINIRVSRDANGSSVTDSMTGDAKLISITRRYRRAL